MARDFKTSFIFPTQTVGANVLGNTANLTQVFRTGFNTLTVNSSVNTNPLTAVTSDYFFIDEMVADQYVLANSDGTKGEGMASAAAPLGIKISSISSNAAGLFTAANHGLQQGQVVVFTSVTGGAGAIRAFRPYRVQWISTSTFYLAENWSTNYIATPTVVSAGVLFATHPLYGLGPLGIQGQAGAVPEATPGQYVRPLYLRCVVQPNITTTAQTGPVNLTNLTVTLTGSYVRGFQGTAGTIADLDSLPYATVASRTFQQVFFDGLNGVPNTGAVFTLPFQTDFPFLRASLSFGHTETATTGLIANTSTINVGMSVVTGRENAQV